MKRYLLLALLFGIVFLWLGSSYASAVCNTTRTAHATEERWIHTFTCEYDSPTHSSCNDNVGQAQSCYVAVAWDSCSLSCCVCTNNNTTTPPSNTWTTPPSNTWTTPTVTWTNSPWWTWGTTPSWGGSNWSAGTTNPDGLTNEKCAAEYNVTTNPQGLGKGGKLNASGLGCTCEGWYKKIDHACVPCNTKGVCCGIELNTNVPFIGRCIEGSTNDVGDDEQAVTSEDAFPVLMGSLTQILVTIILIVSFVLIIVGGIMISTGNPSGGKSLIIKVVIGIALLGASGVILRLINPNFFW